MYLRYHFRKCFPPKQLRPTPTFPERKHSRLFTVIPQVSTSYSHFPTKNDKVYVAMSGGVDSSVSAYLMKEKGLSVEGIYMRNWDSKEEGGSEFNSPCEADWQKVQSVCKRLDIPCRRIDFVKQYWSHVFENTLESYQQGWTPNPDLLCNKEIKFDRLLDQIQTQNINSNSWLVTGHYARLAYNDDENEFQLLRGVDPIKDQTYYLATVPTNKFRNVLFPLGNLFKRQIKEIARRVGLEDIADQPESMGICFVGKKRNFASFLGNYIKDVPGCIHTLDGTVIGQHQGLWSHTIGQRIRISYKSQKWYVSAKNKDLNTLTVVSGRNHPSLNSVSVKLPDFIWSSKKTICNLIEGLICKVKVRSTQNPIKCYVRRTSNDNSIEIQFVEPVWALAPGQYIVLYTIDDVCLGAGIVPINFINKQEI